MNTPQGYADSHIIANAIIADAIYMRHNTFMEGSDISEVRRGSLGWMIQRIAGQLDRQMAAALAPLDLTQVQFAVLMTVLEHDGLSQTAIGAFFGQPPYAISRALDQLVQLGLVTRRPDPASRRSVCVHATQEGRALAPELARIVAHVNDTLTKDLTAQERDAAAQLLRKMLPGADQDR